MIGGADTFFIDDLSLRTRDYLDDDEKETEADEWAEEALIPKDLWVRHMEGAALTTTNVLTFARRVGVHPAIVAGRVRYERRNYRLLSQFVGNGEVRRHFEEGAA